ncbi:hypothetical protein MMC26_001814 [Xylographa opegraphella]|nr:hypothetical protein [Xylographa opegraphella]
MGQPSYIPRHPSPLHISCSPSSPLSPLSPLSPFVLPAPRPVTLPLVSPLPQLSRPPPPPPPAWTWTCHHCSENYPLGATRRCLQDGHYFCSGSTIDQRGNVRKHKACGSVFDYIGWKAWGDWRRETATRKRRRGPKILREHRCGCGTECDFPSQCRWKPRLSTARLAAVTCIAEEDLSPTSPASLSFAEEADSPKSPTSPTSPPLSPRENLLRVLHSVQRRKSASHSPIKHDGSSLSPAFDMPVLSFADFKAQMDNSRSAFAGPSPSSWDTEHDDDRDMETAQPEKARGGPASSGGAVIRHDDFDDVADSIEELDAIDGLKPFRDLSTLEGHDEIVVDVLPDAPGSPRRNAWDWSVGGLGPNMGSMDGFMDIDTCVDI